MIPMIDLLMVTISFLLINAIWSHTARLNADAQVPGRDVDVKKAEPEKRLHVAMRALRYIVGVIDAIYETKRELKVGARERKVSAVNVAFATD